MGLRIITLIFSLLLFNCATGFNITFHNDTEETAIYRLAWISHNFDYIGPVEYAIGEVEPSEKSEVNQGYSAGLWSITWYDCRGERKWKVYRELTIPEDVHQIISTPREDILQ